MFLDPISSPAGSPDAQAHLEAQGAALAELVRRLDTELDSRLGASPRGHWRGAASVAFASATGSLRGEVVDLIDAVRAAHRFTETAALELMRGV